ncbi:MAG: toxin [Desulfobacteraceae bacterium]|nr:toxin [Desulfobacteraceae bacterium]
MSVYLYQPTAQFAARLEKVRTEDPAGYERIVKVIARLLDNPGDADGKMRGLYGGRFKKYVGRSDYRLIYYYCSICRKENRRQQDSCPGCPTFPDQSVIFFDLYHKNESKRWKRG